MKLLTIKFVSVFIYLLSTNMSYAIKQPNLKNLFVYDQPKKLENITFRNIENSIANLDDYNYSLIIINFWATWCKPCLYEMPSLNELQVNKKFKSLKIIPINVGREPISKAINFFENQFYLRGLPTSILINKNGEEFARIIGPINFNDVKFVEWLQNYEKN